MTLIPYNDAADLLGLKVNTLYAMVSRNHDLPSSALGAQLVGQLAPRHVEGHVGAGQPNPPTSGLRGVPETPHALSQQPSQVLRVGAVVAGVEVLEDLPRVSFTPHGPVATLNDPPGEPRGFSFREGLIWWWRGLVVLCHWTSE